jgi:serine/threonine protein kinase
MNFFDWKDYKRIFFFKEIPIFGKSKEDKKSDFLNFYLYYQYHYIISSCFHFMNEKELKENTLSIKYIINEKNLKIYYITIKNVSIPILVKYILRNLEDYQYKNEYYISIYGINELRSLIPNFSYCFYQIPEDNQVQTVFEYIDGITLYQYIQERKKLEKFNLKTEGQIFLSIIFQIVCSLEIAQQTLHFTHFDLHEKNIVLRHTNGKKDITYKIFGKKYKLHLTDYITTFIDFEYSTIRKKNHIISKVSPNLFPLGYYSVFIPGSDLLRLFLNIKFFTMKYSQDPTNFLYYIHQFIDYTLIKFFNFKLSNITSRKALYYHSLYFFNMAFTNRVYKNPYSFLLFLKRNKNNIDNIFNIQSPIWNIISSKPSQKVCCSDIQKFISIRNCVEPKIKDIFSYIQKPDKKTNFMTEQIFLKRTSNILNKTLIPNIILANLEELKRFYIEHKDIKECYEYYFEKYVMHERKNFIFENETYCKDITTLYRILCSMEYFILLKEKYSEEKYSYINLDMKQVIYL